jgi:hypothetical protein
MLIYLLYHVIGDLTDGHLIGVFTDFEDAILNMNISVKYKRHDNEEFYIKEVTEGMSKDVDEVVYYTILSDTLITYTSKNYITNLDYMGYEMDIEKFISYCATKHKSAKILRDMN